jgi:zinc protease
MRILIVLSIWLVTGSAVAFPWGHSHKQVVAIQHWQTTSGTPVYFVPTHDIPMIDMQVVFKAGSSQDEKQWGLATLTNALLNEGSLKHSADQIAESFDNVGAKYRNQVDRDQAIVGLRSLSKSDYLKPALDMFVEVLTDPAFSDSALARVKPQLLAAIQYGQQQPMVVAAHAFYQAIYGEHPYAHPPEGALSTIGLLTQQDVVRFYRRYYTSKNAAIIMVGDLSKGQAKKIAETIAAHLAEGTPHSIFPQATSIPEKKKFISLPTKQNTILIGELGITPNDPDYFSLAVGNHILGGLPLSSLLFDTVRNEHGFAYGVSSRFIPLEDRGPFYISLQTRTDQAQSAESLTKETVMQFLKKGPTQAQLKAAQKNIIGSFPLQISTNRDILAQVTQIAFYHRPLNFLDTYTNHIQEVKRNMVKAAMQKAIKMDRLTTVVVGQSGKSG